MIYIILTCVLSVSTLLLGFTTWNLLKKQEKSEDILAGYLGYLDKLSRVIDASDVKIKELDQMGAFANDDETGIIFEGIKQIQEILSRTSSTIYLLKQLRSLGLKQEILINVYRSIILSQVNFAEPVL